MQGEVAQMWEYIMEPLENVGVYKGVLADQALTQSALYSELTAAAHLTGAVKTYESILWGPGVQIRKLMFMYHIIRIYGPVTQRRSSRTTCWGLK